MTEQPPRTESELVEFVRSIDVPAPPQLHSRIETMVAERSVQGTGRRAAPLRLGFAGALAVAAIAAAIVVGLSGGGAGLTLHKAVALTLRPATTGAPAQDPSNQTELAADVEGVSFPYWDDRFGWRATGARADRVAGREVRTVFYAAGHGQWIGYAIVAGSAPSVGGGVIRRRGGTSYRFLSEDGASVVTWMRDGHLCVVTGHGVSDATLMALASWQGGGVHAA
ncbi:MAG TPA: hypothetical protein VK790_11255 [Solirubrobacteraceae bacterium]|jgi:hypothetical protein|nr:hypothetical protein [Solirubrobacteraceae bacterium]